MIHDPNLQMQCLNSFYFDVLAFAATAAAAAAAATTTATNSTNSTT